MEAAAPAITYLRIEDVSGVISPSVQIISGVVLAAGGKHHRTAAGFAVVVLPLKSLHVLDGVLGRHKRVLAGRLLAPAPPRVPEDVDVGCPVGEAGLADVVHGPGLDGDGAGHGAPQRTVEGGSSEDDLGELGGGADGAVEGDAGAVDRDAMEGLGPPLEGREAEAGYGTGGVGELLDLLRKGEEGDEVAGANGDGEGCVAEGEGGVVRGLAWHLGELGIITGEAGGQGIEGGGQKEEEEEDPLQRLMQPHTGVRP